LATCGLRGVGASLAGHDDGEGNQGIGILQLLSHRCMSPLAWSTLLYSRSMYETQEVSKCIFK
jgi:hypothetical protein